MPKCSSDSLAVVPLVTRAYAPPPTDLSPAAADVWTKTIRSRPVEWFDAGTLPLLETYCRLVVEVSHTSKVLHAIDVASLDPEGIKRYARLLRIVDTQRRSLAMLATKMRLTQQSRYSHRAAGAEGRNRSGDPSTTRKPWERA